MSKTLISIIGPTAIGKTALSIKIAQQFDCPIISADSRQVYREMSIGTAVPSAEELKAAEHYFIQHRSIHENYSAGDFEKEALAKLRKLFEKYDKVVMVGGSGLYLKAVFEGLDHFPEIKPETRENLNRAYQKNGLLSLVEELQKADPESFEKIDLSNPQRVIRALEVLRESGKAYSTFLNQPKDKRFFKPIKIGLTAERQIIYDRIEKRVDLMMEEGLLEEAKKLEPNRNVQALNTVGYKELFSYLDGEISLETAVEEIKKNTRRFAKRQLTWFRKDNQIKWFEQPADFEKVIEEVESQS